MSHEEALALAEEMGGTPQQLLQMRELLTGMLSKARQRSVLADCTEAPTSVTLASTEVDDTYPAALRALTPEALSTEERPPDAAGDPSERYDDICLLGRGGMGEVRRVRDRDLGRTLAMKIASPGVMASPGQLARFFEEAQVSAQLQHPGIIPVHELGKLADGRFFFTMAEVRGRTLEEVVSEVHAGSSDRWEVAESGWTFRRLVDAFHRVCEAVAYAHERGVVHRDLKPDNIMVGAHGEVFVLDWGIAKVTGRPDLAAQQGALLPEIGSPQSGSPQSHDPVVTDRSQDSAQATAMGSVTGTPAYMPPEQAMGRTDRIDARSDVYALGAILYEVLSGRVPYVGGSVRQVLQMVRTGPPQPVGRQTDTSKGHVPGCVESEEAEATPSLPGELVTACNTAMARDPGDRFQSAAELAAVVRDWLDGARRREQALTVMDSARAHLPGAAALRTRATALRAEAASLLADVQPWEPEGRKAPGWSLEDEAVDLERQAALAELKLEQGLQGALRVDPGLAEAHAALAERLHREHEQAESARDREAMARAEAGLREHAGALPEAHEIRQRCAAYLRGDGALSLVTDPPGAEVLLHRYELHNRRLVPRFERSLGRTPLRRASLPMGSYLCLLRHPDRAETRYPVCIGRMEHQDGVKPGERSPHPVLLPRVGALGADDIYIPPGWFWSGGDDAVMDGLPHRRLWLDALVMRRFPITNTEYISFLDDLVAQGREAEALRHVPRERGGTAAEQGQMIYGRGPSGPGLADLGEEGRFELRPDADGDVWSPHWPVLMVDWWGVSAWCRWLAEKAGRPWRLAGELEWEKAARGVDGRFFPWGDDVDPSWACCRESHSGPPMPVVVDSFPTDTSVYGVRGMGGNTRDWCADPYALTGPRIDKSVVSAPPPIELAAATEEQTTGRAAVPSRVMVRGGAWSFVPQSARAANRRVNDPRLRFASLSGRAVFRPATEHLNMSE